MKQEEAVPESTTATAAIVLAAGKSTRMRSRLPKALHPICGEPLLAHILLALDDAGVGRRIVVTGFQSETVERQMDARFGTGTLQYALQAEQRGTGHAAQMAEPILRDFSGTVLVLPGDAPLIAASVLQELIAAHHASNADATVLTAVLDDAGMYGRIVRDTNGNALGIVEAKDATSEQKAIREINTGVFAFRAASLFAALDDLQPNNAQGELYLTDVLGLLREMGKRVGALVTPDTDVILGVNNRVELAEAGRILQRRILNRRMLDGVTVVDPNSTHVDANVEIGQDTILLPNTYLHGKTIIGEGCRIGPDSHLTDMRIGDNVVFRASWGEAAIVGDNCRIGPFAHIRPQTVIGADGKVGNFVELKNARLGEHVSAGHHTYLGDATVGSHTNIGAGTITCNYDGFHKHQTDIGAHTFIGSQTTFVAPVTVGDGAMTAAGSVIDSDVPSDSLAIARERQTVKENWAARRRAKYEESLSAQAAEKQKR